MPTLPLTINASPHAKHERHAARLERIYIWKEQQPQLFEDPNSDYSKEFDKEIADRHFDLAKAGHPAPKDKDEAAALHKKLLCMRYADILIRLLPIAEKNPDNTEMAKEIKAIQDAIVECGETSPTNLAEAQALATKLKPEVK